MQTSVPKEILAQSSHCATVRADPYVNSLKTNVQNNSYVRKTEERSAQPSSLAPSLVQREHASPSVHGSTTQCVDRYAADTTEADWLVLTWLIIQWWNHEGSAWLTLWNHTQRDLLEKLKYSSIIQIMVLNDAWGQTHKN